ncbi:2-amino-4-hydroxy-6-hydroxymethyldihydropteridine diphosphokinase [Dendrosporobacter sp. 1207_IL3150]|uniref:2-amino-4-hydroxy-6- hydroxymethyldihydropteridine diphosphokinase n=1 Tax=Dendrosporobacter sp. 1207_IL3150 TaxID=3084054 RepID=UPI002FD8DDE4
MIFLGLGSNLGDREKNIISAIDELAKNSTITIKKVSSLYETEPYGVIEQQDYLNAVISIDTKLSPFELIDECLRIEKLLGRVRNKRWESRVIDIDLLIYQDALINSEKLTIPHPLMDKRNFVLVPLQEIAGDTVILNGYTAAELLEKVEDSCRVIFYKTLVL